MNEKWASANKSVLSKNKKNLDAILATVNIKAIKYVNVNRG